MNYIMAWFNANPARFNLLMLLILAMSLTFILTRVYDYYKPRLKEEEKVWHLALLGAGYQPILCMIWLLVLFFLLQSMCDAGYIACSETSIFIVCCTTLMVLLLWFSCRFIARMEKVLLLSYGTSHENRATVRAVAQVLRVVVIIVATLVIMQVIGLPISGLVTFGGVGGIVLGFAARDMLANFFGGLMIFWDRPFTEGDWIRSPDRDMEGVVEKIGWRQTKLRTFDKRPLYIPNSIFSTITIENPSRMTNRRIKTTIGLRYDDASKLAIIVDEIEQMLKSHPEIDQQLFMMVRLVEFGASSLNIMLYTFTKTVDWGKFQAIQQDVFLKTLAIIEFHGAECAFPTQTIHAPDLMPPDLAAKTTST